jgi:dihydroorotate dehydrogenase
VRKLFWRLMKWFLFRFDAEKVHRLSVALIRLGIHCRGLPLLLISGAEGRGEASLSNEVEPILVWGMHFNSRLGLAAGFDKDAEILSGLPELGFGFAEIGTVTPRPQPGNVGPRLFRELGQNAIFNRMGFNGLGATLVSERVAEARPGLPAGFRIGINLGKNKDTPNGEAAHDYVRAATAFEGLADYLVINVSSPNTPGLRALQTVEALRPIVDGVNHLITGWKSRPPLLLKLAPEVRGEELREIIEAGDTWGINGWVLTNTLAGSLDLTGTLTPESVSGGWSGGPLTLKSRESLMEARKLTRLPIISVGGVLTPEEAMLRVRLGADLVQIYTGWIFGGPGFPAQVARGLASMRSGAQKSLS